ncbi:hypothetical protein [Mammaliicoccus lentus]|uniref:hypothetical protein n=1 Tax=Mammaliicoccus lentus TaxID=42858 RepID=UPI003A598777
MKSNIISKVLLSTSILTGSVVGTNIIHTDSIQASQETNNQNVGEFQAINELQAFIKLNKNISYEIKDNGTAKLTDNSTGKTEELPYEAKDKNGDPVALSYKKW